MGDLIPASRHRRRRRRPSPAAVRGWSGSAASLSEELLPARRRRRRSGGCGGLGTPGEDDGIDQADADERHWPSVGCRGCRRVGRVGRQAPGSAWIATSRPSSDSMLCSQSRASLCWSLQRPCLMPAPYMDGLACQSLSLQGGQPDIAEVGEASSAAHHVAAPARPHPCQSQAKPRTHSVQD